MSRFLDSRGPGGILSATGISPRLLLTLVLAWGIIIVPLAHSAAMSAHAPAAATAGHHQHSTASHHHDDAAAHCHEEGEPDEKAPASSDPSSMCQSHPVCHMVVLPEPSFELPALDAFAIEIGLSPTPSDRSFEPPLAVPRA